MLSGALSGCCADVHRLLSEMLTGNCSDNARQLPGKYPAASPDASRLASSNANLDYIKGMVSNPNMPVFNFRKPVPSHSIKRVEFL